MMHMMRPDTCEHCFRVEQGTQSCCPFHYPEPVTVGPNIIVCNCEPVHGVHAGYCPSNELASAVKA